MRAVLLLLTMLVCSPVYAEFQASPGMNWPTRQLECGIVGLEPREADNDPIYKILLNVTVNDANTQVQSLGVLHVSVDGKIYDRSEQYKFGGLESTPGKLDLVWQGVWRKNSDVTMLGHLYNAANTRRWVYIEVQFKNNRQQMQMMSICHEE